MRSASRSASSAFDKVEIPGIRQEPQPARCGLHLGKQAEVFQLWRHGFAVRPVESAP